MQKGIKKLKRSNNDKLENKVKIRCWSLGTTNIPNN